MRAKRYTSYKPWITRALLKSIKRKNTLYKRFLNNPSPRNEHQYKCFKNKLNHSLRIAKRLYYEKKIEEAKSNVKITWKLLNEVLNKSHFKQKLPHTFHFKNQTLDDPKLIAERFCDYFTSIGPNLAKKILPSSKSYRSFLSGNYLHPFILKEATEQEIIHVCSTLKPGAALGFDSIPFTLIKETINLISNHITHIFNLSLTSGIVPLELKIARVVPLFKADDKSSFSNYRPISVLPSFSKILEKLVYNRLIDYLNMYKILSDNQFGYRKQHSTDYALTLLYDKVSLAIDDKKFTAGIFIDLSKAIDTVDHTILLDKLQHYGIRGVAHDWFSDYLNNREQFVQFHETISSRRTIKCGVPQGSILGPLLFLIYINDLCSVSKALEFILFADDTNILFSHENINVLEKMLNEELIKLNDWCRANKLSINYKKSKFILFKARQKKKALKVNLKIDQTTIERVKETMFLGVIIDEALSWKSHITNIARKISKSIGIIYRASFCLPISSLCMLYYSLVKPYLVYCISEWGATYASNLKRILLLQKKVLRIISKSAFDAHTDPLFMQLKIL